MAYLKSGQEAKANAVLREGLQSGVLNNNTFQDFEETITLLKARMTPPQEAALRAAGGVPSKPSQSYAETINILNARFADDANGPFREFFSLLVELCKTN